jgi:cytochrome c peroxidase
VLKIYHSSRCWQLLAPIVSLVIVGATLNSAHPSATSSGANYFAAIHFTPASQQLDNRERLTKLIVEARQRGARYVVTPELALMRTVGANSNGQHNRSAPDAEPIPGPTTEYFAAYARRLGIWLVISLPERRSANSDYFLTTILLNDKGELVSKYRKVMVWSAQEAGGPSKGNYRDMIDTVDDRGRRVGIMSGDDILVGVPRLADRGADTILISAGWGDRDIERWDQLCRQLSKQYSVNLVVANRRSAPEVEDIGANKFGGIYARDGRVFLPEAKSASDLILASLPKRNVDWPMETAIGLPSLPLPSVERPSYEIAELGRLLFMDPNLSSNGKVSCGSCHQPERAFTNGEIKGIGVYGRKTRRNVPSLLNVAYRPLLRWDGYASSLENFAKYPINGINEMDFHYLDKVPAYIRSQPHYINAFRSTMGVEEINFDHVERALAAYQRTLISGNSAFDRYFYGKDKSALSKLAQWGLRLFTGKAECSKCHTIGSDHSLFMDYKYHDLGVSWDLVKKEYGDRGLGEISTDDLSGSFLTPSLRDVAQTAPYMHDGNLKTLEEVVDFFNRGGIRSPRLDPIMKPLGLTVKERKALVAFLRALSGDQKYSATGQRLNQKDDPPRALSDKVVVSKLPPSRANGKLRR